MERNTIEEVEEGDLEDEDDDDEEEEEEEEEEEHPPHIVSVVNESDLEYDEEWDGYEPSISDRLQIGYHRMDRACQTSESDVIELKQLAHSLELVNHDMATLKKSLFYAKLTLQAEYNGRLQDELTHLNHRISMRLCEVEQKHEERIDVLRRAYRTQLSDALCKLSRDYHCFYGKRDEDINKDHKKKMEEMEKARLESRKNELLQKDMAEMLRLQAEEKEVVEEVESIASSGGEALRLGLEIEELNSSVRALESKVDYLQDALEEANEDNNRLTSDIRSVTTKFQDEELRSAKLAKEVEEANEQMKKERYEAQESLNEQKEKLQAEMRAKVEATKKKMADESSKQVEELKKKEAAKLAQQKKEAERKMADAESRMKEQEAVPPPPVVDLDTASLLQLQEAQREEIAQLTKELDRKTKLWEMKVKILNEHIHVLKDEMFLRTTLQRQSAKLRGAGVTYVRQGSHDVGVAGVNPLDSNMNVERKYRLPTIIQPPKGSGGEHKHNHITGCCK